MLTPQPLIFGVLLIGFLLLFHDLLFHIGRAKPLGKEVVVRGVHIHHAYVGVALILLAVGLWIS